MVTLGTPDRGTCFQVSQIIGVLECPLTPACTWEDGGKGICVLMALPWVTPFNAEELKLQTKPNQ